MKHSSKTKIKFRLLGALLVLGGLFFLLDSKTNATEYIFEQAIVDPNAVVDVCPNIPGVQATIPAGMQHDGNGNCYTPTTPTPPDPQPPVTVDLCNNLAGVQTFLPYGYYRAGGNCYVQPTPPTPAVDVCQNIDGLQAAMPDGFYLNENNDCLEMPKPVDVCPNIDGPQEKMPEGMKHDRYGDCYTPDSTPVSPPVTGSTDGEKQWTKGLMSVPAIFRPLLEPLVNIIPEGAKEWLRSLPDDAAKAVPYYIFVMVVILALIPILQSIREAVFARQLALILKKERDIAEQKNNFITLASHYLRTPLTLMKSGVDTIVSLGELPEASVQAVRAPLVSLENNINQVLADVERNDALKDIEGPAKQETPSVWRSGWFWGPTIGSVILTIIANFLLVVVGDKNVGVTDTFLHFLVAAVAFVILYLAVRNLYLQRRLHREQEALIEHEKVIDEARNAFINNSTVALEKNLEPISQARSIIANAPSAKFFDEGYSRLRAILSKFLLLVQVQAGSQRDVKTFNLREAINQLLVTYQAVISARKITISNGIPENINVTQNPLLFNFVLESILDNAIKFNKEEGGSIDITAAPSSKTVSIRFTDNGIGIDQEKLSQLFKPFSRATSSIEFNYEGMGFSLFLDKIIMDYTGGDIAATSSAEAGTEIHISTPHFS